jgi:hypothetical protein
MALAQEQHAFLQALMARGVMLEDDARAMHASLLRLDPASADRRQFDRFWGEIARALAYLDLDLRRARWQEDGRTYLGVANKTGGETAKLATRLSPEQIALFRVVLDEILRDETSAREGVDFIAALNATQLANSATQATQGGGRESVDGGGAGAGGLSQAQTQSVAKMTKVEKEATLKTLCAEHWLKQGEDEAGKLKLGVRSFLELREFLLEHAPEGIRAQWEKDL